MKYISFIRLTPFLLFTELKEDDYLRKIGKRIKLGTDPNIWQLFHCLEEQGLVQLKREGRILKINLTEKGKNIQKEMIKIKQILNESGV